MKQTSSGLFQLRSAVSTLCEPWWKRRMRRWRCSPPAFMLLDVNRDGDLDAATANQFSSVSTLLGDGAGDFLAPTVRAVITSKSIATGDFDHNGFPDLVGHNTVLLGDDRGDFTPVKFIDGPGKA